MSTPTQVRRPWRATVRTVVQVAIPTIIALGVVVPQIVQIVLEETGTAMPDGLRAVLLGISAVVVAVAAIVTRIMAIPKVEQFLSHTMRWLAADPDAPADRGEAGFLRLPAFSCSCEDRNHEDLVTALWHRSYCAWYDHDRAGHRLRAALWGWTADRLVNLGDIVGWPEPQKE